MELGPNSQDYGSVYLNKKHPLDEKLETAMKEPDVVAAYDKLYDALLKNESADITKLREQTLAEHIKNCTSNNDTAAQLLAAHAAAKIRNGLGLQV
jgi:hypothetical protein